MKKKFKVGEIVKFKKKELDQFKNVLKNGIKNKFKIVRIMEHFMSNNIRVDLEATSDSSFRIEVNQETLKKVKPKSQIVNPFAFKKEVDKVMSQVNREFLNDSESDKNKYEVERDSVLGQWLTNVMRIEDK